MTASLAAHVSGVRIRATYALDRTGDEAWARAQSIAVEQTIEFPIDLVQDEDIRRSVAGQVEDVADDGGGSLARISYAVETTGWELPQLINVLFGNVSLFSGVRLIEVDLPPELLARFRGPRYGVAGVRRLLDAPRRPLIATALKPMGLDARQLAESARILAHGGIDIIKDDHGLANQPFAPFRDRVLACANAIRDANAATSERTIYAPSVNAPAGEIVERAHAARDAGAGALLVLPGLCGMDTMRALADADDIGLPLLAHPAFLGANVASDSHGIAHGILFGTLMRLAGADVSIFPGYGGRFRLDPAVCRSIADAARAPLGAIAAALPAPAGGITLDRIDELLGFYGPDTVLLISGDLYRGDLTANARRLREAVDRLAF